MRATTPLSIVLLLGGAALTGCDTADEQVPPSAPSAEAEDRLVRAQTVINRTIEHIRQGNMEAAESNLQELERIRQQLPEGMQKQIDTLQASIAAVRSNTVGQPPAQPLPQQ